jgi:pyridoxine 5'-phosphate synthase PdxJ
MLQLLEGLGLLGLGVALGHDLKLLSVKLIVQLNPLFVNLGIKFNLIVHFLAET